MILDEMRFELREEDEWEGFKFIVSQLWLCKPLYSQLSHYLRKGKYIRIPNFPCFIAYVIGQQVSPSHLTLLHM